MVISVCLSVRQSHSLLFSVSIIHTREVAYRLSIGTEIDDLETYSFINPLSERSEDNDYNTNIKYEEWNSVNKLNKITF